MKVDFLNHHQIKIIMRNEEGMRLALIQAQKAFKKREIPVGAIITKEETILAETHNIKETSYSPIAHAEILAIQKASQKLSNWRLEGCTLYVTLEPCLMCAGAILQARISKVVIGALDPKAGAVISLYQTLNDSRLNHRPQVITNVLEQECSQILKDFFQNIIRYPKN